MSAQGCLSLWSRLSRSRHPLSKFPIFEKGKSWICSPNVTWVTREGRQKGTLMLLVPDPVLRFSCLYCISIDAVWSRESNVWRLAGKSEKWPYLLLPLKVHYEIWGGRENRWHMESANLIYGKDLFSSFQSGIKSFSHLSLTKITPKMIPLGSLSKQRRWSHLILQIQPYLWGMTLWIQPVETWEMREGIQRLYSVHGPQRIC